MKNLGLTILLLLIASIVFIVTVFWVSPFPGDIIKTAEFTSGTINSFNIGTSKEKVLIENQALSFSPNPTPSECPKIWIDTDNITSVEKKCLMKSNEWNVSVGRVEDCPEKTDHNLTLHFVDRKLTKVSVVCTLAK